MITRGMVNWVKNKKKYCTLPEVHYSVLSSICNIKIHDYKYTPNLNVIKGGKHLVFLKYTVYLIEWKSLYNCEPM